MPPERRTSSCRSTRSRCCSRAPRVDEWSLIEKKIPSFDLMFAVDRNHRRVDVELSAEQRLIVAAPRRHARRRGRSSRSRAGRVRGRQGALRADHRRLRAPRRHLRGASRRGQRRAGRRAPEPRRRVLQDRHARRGDARVPPRRRAAPERRAAPLLPRAHRAAPGAVGGGGEAFRQAIEKGGPRPRRCTTWRSRWSGWVARRGGHRVRRGGGAGRRERPADHAGRAWSRFARGEYQGRRAPRPRPRFGKPAPTAPLVH